MTYLENSGTYYTNHRVKKPLVLVRYVPVVSKNAKTWLIVGFYIFFMCNSILNTSDRGLLKKNSAGRLQKSPYLFLMIIDNLPL